MEQWVDGRRLDGLTCGHVQCDGIGREQLYGTSKRDDYSTKCDCFEFNLDQCIVQRHLNGVDQPKCYRRSCPLYVLLEQFTNDGKHIESYSGELYGNGNGCEQLYRASDNNHHSAECFNGHAGAANECVVQRRLNGFIGYYGKWWHGIL